MNYSYQTPHRTDTERTTSLTEPSLGTVLLGGISFQITSLVMKRGCIQYAAFSPGPIPHTEAVGLVFLGVDGTELLRIGSGYTTCIPEVSVNGFAWIDDSEIFIFDGRAESGGTGVWTDTAGREVGNFRPGRFSPLDSKEGSLFPAVGGRWGRKRKRYDGYYL